MNDPDVDNQNDTEPDGAPEPRPRWIERHYRWALPTGCATILAVGVAVVAILYIARFRRFRETQPFAGALEHVREMPGPVLSLGRPIEPGWYFEGVINYKVGKAEFTFPVSGPKGHATVEVAARRDNDRWIYTMIVVRNPKTGEVFTRNEAGVMTGHDAKPPDPPEKTPETTP